MKVSAKPAIRRKAQKKHRLYHCPEWYEIRREIQRLSEGGSNKREPRRRSGSGKRGIVTHPLSESQWSMGHFTVKKWESEKHKNWGMPAEGFKMPRCH